MSSGARLYDPTTGQFLTRDPADAATRSAYGYVYGNPLNASDPAGLYPGEGLVNRAIDVSVAVVNAPTTAVAVVGNTVTGGDCGLEEHLTVVCEGGALSDANPEDTAFALGGAVNVDSRYVEQYRSRPEVFDHEHTHVLQYGAFNAVMPGLGSLTYLELYGTNALVSWGLCREQCFNVFEFQAGFDEGGYSDDCEGFGRRRS